MLGKRWTQNPKWIYDVNVCHCERSPTERGNFYDKMFGFKGLLRRPTPRNDRGLYMRLVTVTHGQDCFRFSVPEVKDWNDLADYLAERLKPGSVVALSGPLGAGKTTFVQALAQKLGVKKMPQSPTFSLMRSYPIPGKKLIKRLLHVDAYRIEEAREILALDLDHELADGKTAIVIEWPEKIGSWISAHEATGVQIEVTHQASRHLPLRPSVPRRGAPRRRT